MTRRRGLSGSFAGKNCRILPPPTVLNIPRPGPLCPAACKRCFLASESSPEGTTRGLGKRQTPRRYTAPHQLPSALFL
ncbi:hypothetical protein BJX66DRAFT_297911 [Aspergillus keveii]|uniref:Uncharacterized protein n=1 Tax=Aspergillus keveii TaxID=714993 RepID=A0ABR4GEM1_9EURO